MNRLFLLVTTLYSFIQLTNAQTCDAWNDFTYAKQNDTIALLTDFSYAGYHHGEMGINPIIADTFHVTDYGAIADDTLSDKAAFILALAAAEANGSGVVLFPKGRFRINEPSDDFNEIIMLTTGNVVIAGAGSGPEGTELFMARHMEPTDPSRKWTTPKLLNLSGSGGFSKITHVSANARPGSYEIQVDNASNITIGQWVVLSLNDDNTNLVAEEMYPYPVEPEVYTNLNTIDLWDVHQVIDIVGNTVTFKEPIHREVNSNYNWEMLTYEAIEEVGIENIHFVGNFKEAFVHHASAYHDGGFGFISMSRVKNSWVRNCRFSNMNVGITFYKSANVSLLNLEFDGNYGHNAISTGGSTRIFTGACRDISGNHHSFGVAARSFGNVFWRVEWPYHTCYEAHASQPRYTLYDCAKGGFIKGRWGGSSGNQPNHLRGLTFWNFENRNPSSVSNFEFWVSGSTYGRIIPPIIVGMHGRAISFKEGQVQYNESLGSAVKPESLYEAQLEYRLGYLPDWLIELKGSHGTDTAYSLQKKIVGQGGFIHQDNSAMLFEPGSSVKLQAQPLDGFIFKTWGSDSVSAFNPIRITMDKSKTIHAEFVQGMYESFERYTLDGWQDTNFIGNNLLSWHVNGKGDSHLESGTSVYIARGGLVSCDAIPGGISSFRVSCKNLWNADIVRTLVLYINDVAVDSISNTDTDRYLFEVEGLEVSGDFSMRLENKSYAEEGNASIALDNIQWESYTTTYQLTTTAEHGNILVSPYRQRYAAGSQVALTANPARNYTFQSWSGDATGINNSITIIMDADKHINANFIEVVNTLNALQSKSFRIFPNPASSEIQIHADNGLISEICIISPNGEIISKSDGNQKNEMSLSMLEYPKGIYYLQVSTTTDQQTVKLLLQ